MDFENDFDEKKIKKDWLISLITWVSFLSVSFVIDHVKRFHRLGFDDFLLVTLLSSSVGFFLYYCAYKKHGTKWLIYLLLMLPFHLIKNIVEARNVSGDELFWFMIYGALAIFFWINCFRLYKFNKKYWNSSRGKRCI